MDASQAGRDWRLPTPDEVLLRRFGLVRAAGGGTYTVAVVVLASYYGLQVWPLALGVPVLAVATIAYFAKSADYPRTAVIASLIADALVLGGAVSFLGGSGSGLVLLYTIVVVSAGILLGPGAAAAFTLLGMGLGGLQFGLEQLGLEPVLLHRPEVGDRLPILLVSLAGLAGVGYLSATYAGRLHELIGEAGAQAEVTRRRSRTRRSFVRRATLDVRRPLRAVEEVAERLDTGWEELGEEERHRLAAQLRMTATQLDDEIAQLADLGVLDAPEESRPEALLLRLVVDDCLVAIGDRFSGHDLRVDMPPIKVLGHRRATRRIVFNLLENVADHTPPGTRVRVAAAATAGYGVLAVTDNGPGIPDTVAARMFDTGDRDSDPGPRVGLPLVAMLAEQMGARVRYEPGPDGRGSRFFAAFRLAPAAAPGPDDLADGDGSADRG